LPGRATKGSPSSPTKSTSRGSSVREVLRPNPYRKPAARHALALAARRLGSPCARWPSTNGHRASYPRAGVPVLRGVAILHPEHVRGRGSQKAARPAGPQRARAPARLTHVVTRLVVRHSRMPKYSPVRQLVRARNWPSRSKLALGVLGRRGPRSAYLSPAATYPSGWGHSRCAGVQTPSTTDPHSFPPSPSSRARV
jgi:hypothetical protein